MASGASGSGGSRCVAASQPTCSEVASPRPDDQLTVAGDTFVIQGEQERRDSDRLVWTLDVRPA